MIRRRFSIGAFVVLAAAAIPASAQVLDKPTLYRLERASSFQRGCFAPCDCPMMMSVPVTGTFRLELISVGNVFDFYQVDALRLKVHLPGGDTLTITGSGTYAVSTLADLQRAELTLVVGSEPPTLYHSDDVSGGAGFPRISVPVSIHGMFCFDTVIDIRARPARRLFVASDALLWDAEPDGTNAAYDVVRGDLTALRQTGGAFDVATWACLADSTSSTAVAFDEPPRPGEGFWFLERAAGDPYEDGDAAQIGSPDEGIDQSAGACP